MILKDAGALAQHLRKQEGEIVGCLADTGFLYALAYEDDRLFEEANDVLEVLSDFHVPIYANVISRLEFIDLIFRKQVTTGAIRIYESIDGSTKHKNLFNLLKNIRDQDTAHRNQGLSYKVDENRLKRLRQEFETATGFSSWKAFCQQYVGDLLVNEWRYLEDDFDLNFVEILEGQLSEHFNAPLYWADMVKIMAESGMRGPDAMIVNLFSKSKFPLLITTDFDFETCLSATTANQTDKTILIL